MGGEMESSVWRRRFGSSPACERPSKRVWAILGGMEGSVDANGDLIFERWDAAVAADPWIDPICSRSAWQRSYHEAFAPERRLHLSEQEGSWVLLAEVEEPGDDPRFESLENMWGLGSSLAGPGAATQWAERLRRTPVSSLLLGLPLDAQRLAPLLDGVGGRFSVRALPPLERCVASLTGGMEGWLSRRSKSFRRNLRAAVRRTQTEGIEFRWLSQLSDPEWPGLYRQILEVESASWKGLAGQGVDRGPMEAFYRRLLPRLLAEGQLRILLAERDGELVGYLHGAQWEGVFRGLQFSFDDRWNRLGLGHVLQREALVQLCEAGVQQYDLGTPHDYKQAWSEPGLVTVGLWLQPR